MAHFAQLDENNVVVKVLVTDNNDPNGDEGYQWLLDNFGGTWVKTSYNAILGKRRNPETGEVTDEPGFRKNYAGVGFKYDEYRDAFIAPEPSNTIQDPEDREKTIEVSWFLNEDTCSWEMVVEN